uniref:Uncharacterized protein n=1 Tax=Brassica campestris TaxID=3711 RepID=M4EWA2_BRACM
MSSSLLLSGSTVSSSFIAASKLFGALTVGWFCGSLVIPMIPTAFINPWTLELLTSLVAYVFLFLSCTFLK